MTEEQYLLVCLQEECAGVIKAASKCLRFGMNNGDPRNFVNNVTQLRTTLDHVSALCEMIGSPIGYFNEAETNRKIERTKTYMKVSKKQGILE